MADVPSIFLHFSVEFVGLMQGRDPGRVCSVQHLAVGPRLARQILSVFGASSSCGAPCHACEFQTAGDSPLAGDAAGYARATGAVQSVKYNVSKL